MRPLYFFCSILIFLPAINFSQSCLPDGITFHTQQDIDNFQVIYPGCTVIEGDVNIGDFGGGGDINNLTGLSVLESVGGSLEIRENDSLTSLRGLENITTVGNSLGIINNPGLTNLDGLEGMIEVYYLMVSSNENLIDLTGLENLAAVGYGMHISYNPSLISLNGLGALTSVGAGLSINSNNALTSLEGLNNLATIGNGLSIEFNNSLENIEALSNLVSIHIDDHPGTLSIKANLALTSLNGLDNIEPASIVDLSIGWNAVLSECDVNSICQYLAAPNGYFAIRYNAPGCNNPEEVLAACLEDIEDIAGHQSSLIFYPNPARGISHFAFHLPDCVSQAGISQLSGVSIKIYDPNGREVSTPLDSNLPPGDHTINWDSGTLVPGLYFYHFSAMGDQRSATGKIMVME